MKTHFQLVFAHWLGSLKELIFSWWRDSNNKQPHIRSACCLLVKLCPVCSWCVKHWQRMFWKGCNWAESTLENRRKYVRWESWSEKWERRHVRWVKKLNSRDSLLYDAGQLTFLDLRLLSQCAVSTGDGCWWSVWHCWKRWGKDGSCS